MIRFTIFPRLLVLPGQKSNPYIQDFVSSLEQTGEAVVVNPPHKNPLFSLLPMKRWGDVFVFNWYENVPDYKYGPIQTVFALLLVLGAKMCGRKIVWVLHNKGPHRQEHVKQKRFLTRFIARHSDLILTHAREGIDLARRYDRRAEAKTCFLHHPTKNRLPKSRPTGPVMYDLLIWGQISRYKGVIEYVRYLRNNPCKGVRVCIVGACPSQSLAEEITRELTDTITFINRSPSFEELARYVEQSAFVLEPYKPESVLSSGTLMDSLSFGAKVIGPDTGSFKDYAQEKRLNVYTFRDYREIDEIVTRYRDCPVSWEGYRDFLEENSWPNFGRRVVELVKKC
ncbi:exopolysaccharide biosynthesis protein [Barnesiella viscericola DSM 18177]|uniref:Exopolysaccharide biosynthesis protein n=1 Tax=Barnesiella viscericola DSM 18177 TaxID=880074 RepID=W0ETN1_9BACT|nr:exopolysaccharide biosynthesis protein [Barnesiella viscericola]AHF12554.1 exopolysaccharide biosynthesis protein [Barnesiella viscericola DSM 18177]